MRSYKNFNLQTIIFVPAGQKGVFIYSEKKQGDNFGNQLDLSRLKAKQFPHSWKFVEKNIKPYTCNYNHCGPNESMKTSLEMIFAWRAILRRKLTKAHRKTQLSYKLQYNKYI